MPTGIYKHKTGRRLSKESKQKMIDSHKGMFLKENHPGWKGGIDRFPNCLDCGKKLSAMHCSRCRVCTSKGERNYKWMKDRTKLCRINKQGERRTSAYFFWRKEVWKRDNYKCKINNKDCSGKLESHHILAWRDYPELRYDVNNGITLCHAHHPRMRAEEKRLSPYFKELVSVSKVDFE